MRLFISIEISEQLKDKITEIQKVFSRPGIKLVERNNLHFCLMFIGDVDKNRLDMIKGAMQKSAQMTKGFDIKIAGMGAFPNKESASVFFLDLKDGRKDMIKLALLLRKELPEFKSGKPFTPHLTLGRVKNDNDKLKSILERFENIDIGKMSVDKIELIKSTLTPQGPIYEEIYAVSLGI